MIGFIFSVVFRILLYSYAFIILLSKWMCKPFSFLLNKLKEKFFDNMIFRNLNEKFSFFNGFFPFVLLMTAFVYTGVAFFKNVKTLSADNDFLADIVFNTSLGSFPGFFSNGLDFTPATLIAIGFSSSMLPLCMSAHADEYETPPIYMRIFYYSLYMLTFSILAMSLTDVFQVVGQWGYETIVDLFNQQGYSFFNIITKIFVLIPLCYITVILCLITIRTYVDCFLFGIIGTVILVVGAYLLELISDTYSTLESILTPIFLLSLFFGLDVLQNKFSDIIDEAVSDLIKY